MKHTLLQLGYSRWLQKAAETRCVAGSPVEGPESPLYETIKPKPRLAWGHQDTGDVGVMRQLPRKTAHKLCNQPKKDVLCHRQIYIVLTVSQLFPFGMLIYVLYHYMLKVCNLLCYFKELQLRQDFLESHKRF